MLLASGAFFSECKSPDSVLSVQKHGPARKNLSKEEH